LIRRARAADAPLAAALLRRFNSEYDEPAPDQESLAENFRSMLDTGEITVLLAGDAADGFCQFSLRRSIYTGKPDAHLEELYVVPEKRGRGLGRALLETAMAAAREAGATHIELNTGESDAAARALYESAGFTNREGGEDGPRMLYYEREL
jgi:ribosomal protein S18 acetylase RimI-like enzyme